MRYFCLNNLASTLFILFSFDVLEDTNASVTSMIMHKARATRQLYDCSI